MKDPTSNNSITVFIDIRHHVDWIRKLYIKYYNHVRISVSIHTHMYIYTYIILMLMATFTSNLIYFLKNVIN